MKRRRRCCCWQLPQWLVKIAFPQFLNSCVVTYKGFFLMVRKSEKPSHFQECFGSPGISDILLSSLSLSVPEGFQHFLVTWSMITRFISGESWFKKFLLVIKITMINSDFKIFSLKSFPTRLERPNSRRRRKLNLHVHVTKCFISTWPVNEGWHQQI